MNSRERVKRALEHREPDKVPIGIGGSIAAQISAIAYNHLKRKIGLSHIPTKILDLLGGTAVIDPELYDFFGTDFIQVLPGSTLPEVISHEWKERKLPDGSSALVPKDFNPTETSPGIFEVRSSYGHFKQARGTDFYDYVQYPFENIHDTKEIKELSDDIISDEELLYLGNKMQKLFSETDKAIVAPLSQVAFLEGVQSMIGWERAMIEIIANQGLFRALIDWKVENCLENMKRIIPAISDYAMIVEVWDDLGTQKGLQISTDLYRKIIKPAQAEVYGFIKKNSDLKIMLHSCGSIKEIIPDLIEIGVDIINPVQTSAIEMDAKMLKKEFGNDIVFWGGGIENQSTLRTGTLKDIRKEVKERIEIFGQDGGYVFAPIHNITAEVEPEKIIEVFEAAKEYR